MDSVLWEKPSENDEHHASKFRHGGTREVEERFVRELGDCDAIQKEQDEGSYSGDSHYYPLSLASKEKAPVTPKIAAASPATTTSSRPCVPDEHPEHADLKRGFGDDFDPTLLNRDKVKQSPEASSAKLTVKTVRGQGQRGEQ